MVEGLFAILRKTEAERCVAFSCFVWEETPSTQPCVDMRHLICTVQPKRKIWTGMAMHGYLAVVELEGCSYE